MTRLLYLEHPNLYSCEATVTHCFEEDGRLAIILDQSPFYPEGGGQPCDLGQIGNCVIIDVQKTPEGEVKHFTLTPWDFAVGDTVPCTVDAERRLDLSQQHSGQHLLSAAAYHLLDAKTVGFHLSEQYTTVDLDKKLSPVDIETIEKACFEHISLNLSIEASYPETADLNDLPLRKQPKVTEAIRVIAIGTYDYSPCGGTHLKSTAELMGIKVIKSETYKGGTRLTFVVGHRFVNTILRQQRHLETIAQKLSAPLDGLVEAFDKREQLFESVKAELATLKEALLENEVSAWLEALEEQLSLGAFSPLTIRQYDNRSLDDLKKLSSRFVESQETAAICITNRLDTLTQFVLVRPKGLHSVDCKALLAELAKDYAIKGGGSPLGVQGSLVNPEQTEDFIQRLEQLYNTNLETN